MFDYQMQKNEYRLLKDVSLKAVIVTNNNKVQHTRCKIDGNFWIAADKQSEDFRKKLAQLFDEYCIDFD